MFESPLFRVLVPFLILTFAPGRAAEPIAMGDYTVTATGSFFCFDGSVGNAGVTMPLAGARVELWDSDCDGSTICDDFMGSSIVQPDGHFSVTGTGGDDWSPPDVYLRIVYNDDQGVRLTDEANSDRWVDTPEHDHNNTAGGTVDFGVWTIGQDVGAGNASKCGVWLASHNAYQDYVKLLGGPPPAGKYDVEYWSGIWSGTPWTNDNTSHWPIHYWSSAQPHEFAHSVRHAADGDRNHFNWDVTRFRYARNHDVCDANSNRIGTDTHEMGLAFGFNEGWAEFWEDDVRGCWAITIDDENEGNNAFALNVLANQPGVGKPKMVAVLKAHPEQIHSLDQFISFLAPSVGVNSSALSQSVTDARRVTGTKTAFNHPPRRNATALKADLRSEMTQVESSMQLTKRALQVAIDKSHQLPPCVREDCEKAVIAAIDPAMLNASLAAQQVYYNWLKTIASSRWQEQFESTMLAKGGLDEYLAKLRASRGQELQRIWARAFQQSIAALEPLQHRSPGVAKEIAQLKAKQAHLMHPENARDSTLFLSAGMAVLKEDRPVMRTPQ